MNNIGDCQMDVSNSRSYSQNSEQHDQASSREVDVGEIPLEGVREDVYGRSVPVYVMLPLDTVNADGVFRYASAQWFLSALRELKNSGIHGVAVDVWWGAVERKPRMYDFSGYKQLFELLVALDLKIQVVLAFHACGGNVGDNAEVPLPHWVLSCGERDPDIFYTDKPREFSPGRRNPECISLFADTESGILRGRSPIQCYVDFMKAFRDEFILHGDGVYYDAIGEIVLGTGPCGELRYPSYPEMNGWRFPGIGEFQCYDRRALASLARAAEAAGHPEWGHAGPPDVGHYNSTPDDTAFFRGWDGTWATEYGKFFLDWYSQALVDHGDRMLHAASTVFCIHDLKTPRSDTMESGRRSDSLDLGGDLRTSKSISCNDFVGISSESPRETTDDLSMNSPKTSASDPGTVYQSTVATGLPSRGPSYASFRSSTSISDGLNTMEEWIWPSPQGKPVNMNLKIAGIHWWYHTKSHAAELTAGYYNCDGRNGYDGIISLCARYGVALTLTCVEMCDSQHPPEALCGPEGLLRTVKESAFKAGLPLAGENALPCFMPNAIDESALQRIVYNTQPLGTPLEEQKSLDSKKSDQKDDEDQMVDDEVQRQYNAQFLPPMRSFTFLRLTTDMMSDTYQNQWKRFMKLMSRNALRFKTSQRWRRDLGFE
mmetsp:Transcript_6721/g.13360  ORF Transcript_6721/g.13360 Transcript_6721/m.13360 type:complete len:657 (-) Transcript_6721:57-2027(-)|eukprot:CAMPEP_0118808794 /NCGR_PEP_ID=MMETSP1161-20130426/36163_1 /TAXON_ID=249345 /ORGANISM="Picochlorum oklahomensis, Strain CCMP2329" /LENGTH=656 /DNA_ID=CAMNT_0006738187 /DNA_START=409 /DNA_END=2379 /DNA_ORIENTATION=+